MKPLLKDSKRARPYAYYLFVGPKGESPRVVTPSPKFRRAGVTVNQLLCNMVIHRRSTMLINC